MWEFESTAAGTRTRCPKRRIIGREQAGDVGPGGVGLASRLVSLWTSFIARASPGQWESENVARTEQGRINAKQGKAG
jgi:hypothetical protein